jgi:hypothetical protein
MNELSIIEKPATELYAPGAIRSILDGIKDAVRKTVIDPTTDKGRKEIASLAHKVAKTKVALDEAGKKLTEDARAQIDAVNAERKIVRDELDALKEEVRKPLTEYEEREKARVAKHQAILAHIDTFAGDLSLCGAAELAERHATLKALDVSNLDEFSGPAETKKNGTLYLLAEAHAAAAEKEAAKAKAEADRIERERIEREEREARIAAEAAERARVEAEEKAKRQAEEEAARVAAETRRADEAREAERKAGADRIAAAERQVKEAQERAAREIAEAAERQKREAESAERARLAAVEAERIADEKRAANKKHRDAVIKRAVDALEAEGVETGAAGLIVLLIAGGKIPAVSIQF